MFDVFCNIETYQRKMKVIYCDGKGMMEVTVNIDPSDYRSILKSLQTHVELKACNFYQGKTKTNHPLISNVDFDGLDCVRAGNETYDASKSLLSELMHEFWLVCLQWCGAESGGCVIFCLFLHFTLVVI